MASFIKGDRTLVVTNLNNTFFKKVRYLLSVVAQLPEYLPALLSETGWQTSDLRGGADHSVGKRIMTRKGITPRVTYTSIVLVRCRRIN
jgi:hypothetical protein